MRAKAVRRVREHPGDYPSEWAAIGEIARRLGIGSAETLRKWVRQAEIDDGKKPGTGTAESAERFQAIRRPEATAQRVGVAAYTGRHRHRERCRAGHRGCATVNYCGEGATRPAFILRPVVTDASYGDLRHAARLTWDRHAAAGIRSFAAQAGPSSIPPCRTLPWEKNRWDDPWHAFCARSR
jgi:transposase